MDRLPRMDVQHKPIFAPCTGDRVFVPSAAEHGAVGTVIRLFVNWNSGPASPAYTVQFPNGAWRMYQLHDLRPVETAPIPRFGSAETMTLPAPMRAQEAQL